MTDQRSEIRIYVACLAAYNNGILHGRWINARQEASAIWKGVISMLAASPIEGAEEWAIHDYEGFGDIRLSEWDSFERVSELAIFLGDHGTLGAHLLGHFDTIEDAEHALNENYAGEYRSAADFVQDMVEQSADIADSIQPYIDWQAMARDWEINDILTIETGFECIHVFWRG